MESIGQTVKLAVNSNYRIEQLEKNLRFADNVTNRIQLADAYVAAGRYPDAIALYEESMSGFMADDPTLKMKALVAHFQNKSYDAAITYGRQLENEKSFKNAEERIAFAWSLHFAGNVADAEKEFGGMNKTFTNYPHRLAYVKFLKLHSNHAMLEEVVKEMFEEHDHMKGTERRLYRDVFNELRDLVKK
ncbi:hypothetical protein DQQ10_16215 [Pseudochryseolinea flava]|uniref:Tetratricopeptide repeat protein n=2 Tax=Pseudochryseolinea flava TaxID=2059302 RepID=A0A364Y1E3_9BACT|nr:hypothetical protein DQQ10_16215 [Pseudochryseolinea flava]